MIANELKAKIYGSFTEYAKFMIPLFNGEHPWALFHELIANTIDRKLKEGTGGTIIFQVPPQHGKEQPLSAKIKTHNGWTTMGNIKLGDLVDSGTGSYTKVTGVFPQGLKPVYRVTMSDGSFTECGAEHLWECHHRDWDKPRILTTLDLIGKSRIGLPRYVHPETPDIKLPLDPYLLGSLLGDGSLGSHICFSTADKESAQELNGILNRYGCNLVFGTKYEYRITNKRFTQIGSKGRTIQKAHKNLVKEAIIKLGLLNTSSYTKFIPEIYKHASKHQKIELIRGLMDTDGSMSKSGNCDFATSSPQLAIDMEDLLRSVGFLVSTSTSTPTYTYKGEKMDGAVSYKLSIKGKDKACLFKLSRKHKLCNGSKGRADLTYIKKVELVGEAQQQCIAVDNPRHLYVTDNYIVTHNTALAGQMLMSYYMAMYPDRALLYATHSSDRAINFTKQELMPHIFSDKYKELFPHMKTKYDLLDNDKASKETRKTATLSDNAFSLVGMNPVTKKKFRGRYLAVGVGQSISGYPASLIVVDDFFGSAADSQSEKIRTTVNSWYKKDIEGRSQSNALKIVFCTRWHSEDIIGMILREAAENEDPDYQMPELVSLPAQLELHHDKHPADPRQVGDYLWDIYKFKYASAKKDESTWAALYQQEPLDTRGLVLKLNQLKYYDFYIRPTNVYISIDTNFKAESENGDKCGITIWQHNEPNKYLLDIIYAKLDFNQLLDVVAQLIAKYPMYSAIIIEEKANGRALYELLRRKFARCVSYVLGTNSKMERFQWCLPEFIAGNVYLPMSYDVPSVTEYKRQLLAFTGAKGGKDDLVDSTSMFLNFIRTNCITSNSTLVEYADRANDTVKAAMFGSSTLIQEGLGCINIDIGEMIDF